MKSLSFLGTALVMVACLAWSPADARLFNTEVPKTNTLSESILSLIATEGINKELAKMKKAMPSDAAVAQLEDMVQAMVPTDGGTKYIDDSHDATKAAVNKATTSMLENLESDYEKAKEDLEALHKAIDNSVQTISSADLEAIKMKAQDWCSKKRALETAIANSKQTEDDLADCLAAPLGLPHILVKEVSGLGEADCSKSQGTPRDGSCPPQSCTLSSRVATKVDLFRGEYLRLSWLKYDRNNAEEAAMIDESKIQGAFEDSVKSTAMNYHSICENDYKIHDDATGMFNANNDVRASMYQSLGTIQCYMNHMKVGETFDIGQKLGKGGEINMSTSANKCIANLRSVANIKTGLFPDAKFHPKECPGVEVYKEQIRKYGNFGFDEDKTKWSPTQTNCDALVDLDGIVSKNIVNGTFFFIGP